MSVPRSLPITLIAYCVAVVALLGAISAGGVLVARTSTGLLPQTLSEQSAFDAQLATARQIREVLARPLPQPQPLGPITAKRANPVPQMVAHTEKKRQAVPQGALDAMAMESRGDAFQYAPVDRYAPH
jgi:hypothetical protein